LNQIKINMLLSDLKNNGGKAECRRVKSKKLEVKSVSVKGRGANGKRQTAKPAKYRKGGWGDSKLNT